MNLISHLSHELGHGSLLIMTFVFALCTALAIAHATHRRQHRLSARQSRVTAGFFATGMALMIVLLVFSAISDTNNRTAQLQSMQVIDQQITEQTRAMALTGPAAPEAGIFQLKYMQPAISSNQQTPR